MGQRVFRVAAQHAQGAAMTRSAEFKSKSPISAKTWIILAVAIASGVLAASTARQHLNSRVRQLEEQAAVPTVQRVVAAQALHAGVILETEHLATRDYPAHLVSSDSVPPEAHAL